VIHGLAEPSNFKGKIIVTRVIDEAGQRRALAAAHRLTGRNRWDDLIFTLLSARVPGEDDRLIVSPFPGMCAVVTATSLVKVDLEGKPVNGGRIDIDGFPLYGAIHKARPDIGCILHLHTTTGVAISTQVDGLQPISQTAMLIIGDLAYCDYAGIGEGDDDVVAALGNKNNLILRNHGTLSVGASVAEAFGRLHVLECACAIQIAATAGGAELVPVQRKVISSVEEMGTEYLASGVLDDAWERMVAVLDREEPGYAA